ncbi:MAG TPA: TIGR02449 family protein [Gammaproteobacteria bacterium]|nr:TIGR02449 family protein [Gammaproteobacteria bacterium]
MSNEPTFRLELKRLEERLEEVLALCSRLQEENRSLQEMRDQLAAEKANLMQRNEQVKSRVEAIITRLKSLEQSS